MQATVYTHELISVWRAVHPHVWEDGSWGETVPLFPAKSMHSLSCCSPVLLCTKPKPRGCPGRVSQSFSHKRNVSVNVLRQMLRDSFCFLVLYVSVFSILWMCIPSSGRPYSPAFLAAQFPCNTARWTEWQLRCFSETALLAAIINNTWNGLMHADSVILYVTFKKSSLNFQ